MEHLWLAVTILVALIADSNARHDDPLFVLTSRSRPTVISGERKVVLQTELETCDANSLSGDLVGTSGKAVLRVPQAGGAATALYVHSGHIRFATLSGDGQLLSFTGMSDGKIYLARRGDSGQFGRAEPIAAGYGPSFSADGKQIYFESAGLHRIDLATRKIERFAPDMPDAHTVRCSRDGKYIAFSMNRAMYLYRTSDNTTTRLTAGDAYDRFPAFVGDTIYFVRQTRDGHSQVVARQLSENAKGGDKVVYEGDVELVCPTAPQ